MTGGGAADLAFGLEASFLGSVSGGPDYYKFGRDPTEEEVSIDNMLQRMHEPDSVWSVESVKDNFEGAFGVSAVVNESVFPNVEDIVFNDTNGSGNKIISAGRPQTAKIYAGVDYLSGTVERVMEGFIPVDFEINYQQSGKVRYTLTGLYADENYNGSITPSSVSGPSSGGHAAAQDFDLQIDSASLSKLQSTTFSITGISRFQRDGNPTPADVVVGQPTATLDTTAIYNGDTRLEYAYGSSGSTSAQDRVSSNSATMTIDNAGSTISTYNLANVKPATYNWQDLIAGDSDLVEPVTWNVDGSDAVIVA